MKLFFNKTELCCVLCLIENALLDCFCNVLFTDEIAGIVRKLENTFVHISNVYFVYTSLQLPQDLKGDLVEIKVFGPTLCMFHFSLIIHTSNSLFEAAEPT